MDTTRALLSCRTTDGRPVLLHFRSSTNLIFISLVTAVFTDLFLYGVIVPVVPFALESRVGVPSEDVQHWVTILVAIYGVFLLIGCPFFGYISDLADTRRWPYLIGLVGLAGATGLLCAGTNIALWITGRALQGFTGAVVCTTGTALLVDTVAKNEIGHYLGYLTAAQSLGILLGPLLGGVVYDRGGYYAVFEMCFGIIAVDIALRLLIIERKSARRWLNPEQCGEEEIASDVVLSADKDQQMGPETPTTLHPRANAREAVLSGTFECRMNAPGSQQMSSATVEAASSNQTNTRLPPVISLLKSRRLLVALYGSLVQAALLTAFDSTLPIFVHNLFRWDALGAGLIFLPVALPTFVCPLVGYLNDRIGPRWFAVGGFILAVPPLVCLRFVEHDSTEQKAVLCVLLALAGLAIATTLPSLTVEISYIVDKKDAQQPGVFGKHGAYAQAYGLFWMAFAAGCLVGPLWGGFVQQAAGWDTMSWSLALLSGTTALPVALWTGGWIFDKSNWNSDRDAAGERAVEERGYA